MKIFFTRSTTLLLFISLTTQISTFATVFDVNSLANTNTGSANSGTLNYCISQANASAGPHTINFSVAGTISINPSALPVLNQSITIDGTTAPGYSGSPVIILDGTGLGSGNGIQINAANCALYGLVITSFPYRGIYVYGNSADNFIIGAAGKGNIITLNGYYGISVDAADNGVIAYNKIGVDATGTNCAGNNYDGIDFINAADNNQVLSNHISCNGYNGIQIGGSSSNVIKGNVIGPLSGTCQGNLYRGIDIEDASQNNVVGGTIAADFNKITGNQYWGIEVKNTSPNNLLSGNIYLCNIYGAIALNNDGNSSMPSPVITSANGTTISGTSNPNATVEVFKSQNTNSSQCTGTPTNQGADFLATTSANSGGTWSLSGTFGGYVTATATDANGNTSPFSTSVFTGINDTLINECSGSIISITAAFNSSASGVCEKSCIDFTDQSQNAVAWSWEFTGGSPSTSIQQNPSTICYNDSGVYPVSLVVHDANGDSSVAVLYITVFPTPPIPTITEQGDTLTSSPGIGYQWYFNTVAITGATDQQYVVSETGFYYVQITDSTGCTSISQATYLNITGLSEIPDSWIGIQQMPDPSAFQLVIHGMTGKQGHFSLYDLYGRLVMDEIIPVSSSIETHEIHLHDAADGLYFIKFTAGEEALIQKFILHRSAGH